MINCSSIEAELPKKKVVDRSFSLVEFAGVRDMAK